jgi:AcrR family transcriptional regulator
VAPVTEPGLRERKKQRTRQLIAETAWRLFAERGFEHVTVAEVARAAEVYEATVFNYFRTKEALVFDGMEAYETALLAAVRTRAAGETALQALGRFLLDGASLALQDEIGDTIAVTARMVAASPALLAREREIIDRHTAALARLLADETGTTADDAGTLAAAHALMGVHRTILHCTRQAAQDGLRGRRLADSIEQHVTRAIERMGEGLSGYAHRPDDPRGPAGAASTREGTRR